jgi:hypothetical protein
VVAGQVAVPGDAGWLIRQAGSGVEVALLIADEHLADVPAVDFLAGAHELHSGAKRILLIDRGDWSGTHPAVLAMAVGSIDPLCAHNPEVAGSNPPRYQ